MFATWSDGVLTPALEEDGEGDHPEDQDESDQDPLLT
jgi:hypothetical protein